MTIEGLKRIYPADTEPIVPAAIDAYLTDIELDDVGNAPKQVIGYPAQITDRLKWIAEAARHIEVDRHFIAYHGSVLKEVHETSPETIGALPEDQQQQVMELISRMHSEDDQPS